MFSLAIHAMVPVTVPITPDVLSVVAGKLTFVGTVTLFFLVTYYIIACVFLKYESRLQGNRIKRALLFGGLVGGIWWVGMVEAVFALGTAFIDEFVLGFLDFLPIVLLCFLLAVILVEDKPEPGTKGICRWIAMLDTTVY